MCKKYVQNNNKLRQTFKTEPAKKKRGPKKYKITKKAEHSAFYKDNNITKIQKHNLNIKVSFINDFVFIILV